MNVDAARARHARFSAGRRAPPRVRRRRSSASVYDRYGFEPLETPAAENIETLLGKYGEEGSKLIFKILKRGEHEASGQADLALRYDLTVPLARVVAEYQAKLPKFFKRYQIQPVWRAERPARGRFREFYQCDIDAIGSTSPVVEAEQIAAVSEMLTTLGFERLRHSLESPACSSRHGSKRSQVAADRHADVLVALDKLDKIGEEGVARELGREKGSPTRRSTRISVDWRAIITPAVAAIRSAAARCSTARHDSGSRTCAQIVRLACDSSSAGKLRIDPRSREGSRITRARSWRSPCRILPGSLGGGGRYDNLIGMFLGSDVPACGFSLGLERILVVMQERGMFPPRSSSRSSTSSSPRSTRARRRRRWRWRPSFGERGRCASICIRTSRRRWTGFSSTSTSARRDSLPCSAATKWRPAR